MISILAQERLLGAALGCVFASVVVLDQRKKIYESISESHPEFAVREPIFEKRSGLDYAHLWNKAVDQTLGPVIKSLSLRGW